MDHSLYNKEYLLGRYYPQIVFCYFREWNGYYMDAHTHNEVEIMYALSGKCTIEIDGKSILMKNGDFILLDANKPHGLTVETDRPCRMLNIQFVFVKADGIFPSYRELAGESALFRSFLELGRPYAVLKEVYSSLKGLINEMNESREESSLILHSQMLQLILQISRLTLEARDKMPEASDIYVKKAIQFMQHHYDCDIQTADMAAEINIHPVYLHRIFKERTGSTIIEYLTKLRLEKAQRLLADTDIPIIEISNYVGMNSRQYFTYTFKKHTGMTPAAYRKAIIRYVDEPSLRSRNVEL